MAMSATAVGTGKDTKIWDVIAAADADTDLDITHGMSGAPAIVHITPIAAKGPTGLWYIKLIDATKITVTKGNVGAGAGDAAAQIRVVAKRRTHIEA